MKKYSVIGGNMKYILISFRSRNNVMSFLRLIRSKGVIATTQETPKSISSSCGLSIKTDYHFYNQILSLLSVFKTTDFIGVFLVNSAGLHNQIQKLY